MILLIGSPIANVQSVSLQQQLFPTSESAMAVVPSSESAIAVVPSQLVILFSCNIQSLQVQYE